MDMEETFVFSQQDVQSFSKCFKSLVFKNDFKWTKSYFLISETRIDLVECFNFKGKKFILFDEFTSSIYY